jgi:hypothetical protein
MEKVGTVVVAPLYLQHLTIPFISKVRAQEDFWVSLERLERASVERDGTKYCAAFKAHLQLISANFSEHLINSGHRDLVKTQDVSLWIRDLEVAIGVSTVILGSMAAWTGLPQESVWSVMAETAKNTGPVFAVLTGLVKMTGAEAPNPDFKSFEISLRKMAS